MRRVVFNQKGGVGKSSITTNLAAISAHQGLRTLVIDLDPQCNTTQYLLGDGAKLVEKDIGDFFLHLLRFRLLPDSMETFITPTVFDNLDIIAAHDELYEIEDKLISKHKIYKLRDALDKLHGYDAIYIDTPPALNFYSMSALIAAYTCLVPFDCDEFSRKALYTLMENLEEIQADHNANLSIEGIIVNQFQGRANLPQRIVQELIDEGHPVVSTYLSSSVKMRESHEEKLPLIHLAPKHRLTTEFVSIFRELQGFEIDEDQFEELEDVA